MRFKVTAPALKTALGSRNDTTHHKAARSPYINSSGYLDMQERYLTNIGTPNLHSTNASIETMNSSISLYNRSEILNKSAYDGWKLYTTPYYIVINGYGHTSTANWCPLSNAESLYVGNDVSTPGNYVTSNDYAPAYIPSFNGRFTVFILRQRHLQKN